MNEILLTPLLAGLSTGIYCFTYCIPFIAPHMVSEDRSRKENIRTIIRFISGRFIGYLVFGGVVGYLGEKIDSRILDIAVTLSLAMLSIVVILNSLRLLSPERLSFCRATSATTMGFFMGINVCPPFLMSLSFVYSLHDLVSGIVYFIIFFAGTSLYFLPLFFLGPLGGSHAFRFAGRISAVLVGIIFLVYSSWKLWGFMALTGRS